MNKAKTNISAPSPDQSKASTRDEQIDAAAPADVAISSRTPEAPAFVTLQRRPWVLTDLIRVFLIFLSLTACAGLVLILLPQPAFDKIIKNLQERQEVVRQEQIAFLYLGDEITNNELHLRGVIRNITPLPIEQLDAIIRLYAPARSLLETTVVRMDKEMIGPNEAAQFELVHPNYRSEFGSYSVEFKLRQGSIVPYKDMRTMQARSD